MTKKLLALILSLAMVIPTIAFADGEDEATTSQTQTTETTADAEADKVDDTSVLDPTQETDALDEADTLTPEPTVEPTPEVQANSVSFSDIDSSHWAYNAIMALAERNVINGMGDGTYNPNGTVTREQFIKLLVAAYQYGGEQDAIFMPNDVDRSSWSYTYIRSAIIRKIVKEDTLDTGLFLPTKDVTRAVAVNWLANSLNTTTTKACPFPDIKDDTTKNAATIAAEHGLITGYTDYTFRPDRTLTRAEAAIIIGRLLGLSERTTFPEHGAVYEVAFTTVDKRNSWAVDGTNINIKQNGATVAFGTTDKTGKFNTYLPNGEYNVLATNGNYETINLTINVEGKGTGYKLNLVPLSKSEFNNIYPSMTDDQREAFTNAINYDSVWSAVPSEYDYRTGYAKVLESVLNVAPFLTHVGFTENTSAKASTGNTVAVKSLAERVDMYILYHFGLAPNYSTKVDSIALSYKDGYWCYERASASTKSTQRITPEALYTSDNRFYYLKYSLDSSPDTKYAVVYKTDVESYQILWTSASKMNEDDLTKFMNEATTKFPCALPSSEVVNAVINVKDPQNGYSIDNVTLKIYDAVVNKVNEGVADINGNHSVSLGKGSYIVKATHPDYADTYTAVTLTKDGTVSITMNKQ